ncbi:MAG TPA: hypothetical protein VFP61_15225 [Acidimicrobiales bacterium]|nr:hypothetical protein [Acidimicrobiales bacterium]
MVLVVLAGVCAACVAGWWWLGHTATPGQRAFEERRRAARRALWRTPALPTFFGRGGTKAARDVEYWTRSTPAEPVPEPVEHQQPWRR